MVFLPSLRDYARNIYIVSSKMNSVVIATLHVLGCKGISLSSSDMPTTEGEYNAIVLTDPKPDWEEFKSQVEIQKNRIGKNMIRSVRNALIAQSDWLMTVDNIATLANKDEWIAYRQLLRDLPDSGIKIVFLPDYSSLDPISMVFPTRPPITRTTA
jgi:hypothetical protein